MAETLDTLQPLPDIKRRRSSAFFDENGSVMSLPQRIMRHWAPPEQQTKGEVATDGSGVQVHFADKFDDDDMPETRSSNGYAPNFAVPRRISLSDMQDILSDCISEQASRRESMAGKIIIPDAKGEPRRGSIQVRRPSMDVIQETAERICGALGNMVGEGISTDGIQLMTSETLATGLDAQLPEVDILDMEEDFVPDEYFKPTEELTLEEARDTWTGMIDTSAPPQTAKIPSERPIAKQISEAIDELTSNLGNLESDLTGTLNALSAQRPQLANTSQEIQADMAEFIQKLQDKLGEKSGALEQDAQAEINERSVKAELLREEQDRLEQLRQEQDYMKIQKEAEAMREAAEAAARAEAEAAAAAEAAVQPEEVIEEEEEEEERITTLNIPEAIQETNEVVEVVEPTEKRVKKKKVKKEGEEGEKKKKKKSKSKGEKAEKGKKAEKESGSRRRKTSTGQKLSRLRTNELLDVAGPEQTPSADKTVSVDEFLSSAGCGRPKAVLKYIMDGGDINQQDDHKRTALQKACLYGEGEIIDVLLSKKARVNLSDKLGDTALHWAARGGHSDVVEKLVKGGAKINAKDKLFSTPLHVAVRCGVQEVVDALLELGADVNAKDREGDTPMHDAVRLGRFKLIKTLLAAGANLRQKNMNGATAIDMVQLWYQETKSHHAEIILQALTTVSPPQ